MSTKTKSFDNGGNKTRGTGMESPKLVSTQHYDSTNSVASINGGGASPRQTNQKQSRSPTPIVDLGPLQPFLKPDFDVASFTKEAMLGNSSDSGAESLLLSLKRHLETVEHAISSHVVTHEDSLLGTLEAVGSLKREMIRGKNDSTALLSSLSRVENDFDEPLERLKSITLSLKNAHDATGILRRLGWFLVARKKLKAALEEQKQASTSNNGGGASAGKEASKAAQLVAELEELINEGGLKGVNIVDSETKWIREVGVKVRQDAQKALEKAIVALNQGEMGLALQAFFHLGILEDRVNVATIWAAKEFAQEARDALRDVNTTAANSSDVSQRVQALRSRTDTMLERSLRSWALRVWNLQRVLTKKRDPTTHVLFSDVVKIDVFEQFWNRATAALEQELKTCSRWVREALVDDYARLRRAARAMLIRLWTSTSSVNNSSMTGATGNKKFAVGGPKETQSLMQAFHPFLGEFLARSLSRLNQPVLVMFPEDAGGLRHVDPRPKSIPTPNDVATFAQIIGKELALVKGDNELLGAIAKACGVSVSLFAEKSEALISKADAAHTFRLVPPEFNFSTSSASALPISSTARTSAQEQNVTILTLVSLLTNKVKEIIDAATSANATITADIGGTGDDGNGIGPNDDDVHEEMDVPAVEADAEREAQPLEDEDDDDDLIDQEQQHQKPVRSPPPVSKEQGTSSTGVLSKLEQARSQLDVLIEEIMLEYVAGDYCFKALDDILQEVNAENYNLITDAPQTLKSFANRFTRATKTLREEHLSKLPNTDHVCQESISRLLLRLSRRFSFRVACVRPINDLGRRGLARDVSSVLDSLLSISTAHGGNAATNALKDDFKGLERLIIGQESSQALVKQGVIRKALVWHHLFASAPPQIHSPYTRANKTVTQYLNDIETLPDDKIWPFIAECLHGKDDQFRKQFVDF
jgi:hypothetical protein